MISALSDGSVIQSMINKESDIKLYHLQVERLMSSPDTMDAKWMRLGTLALLSTF